MGYSEEEDKLVFVQACLDRVGVSIIVEILSCLDTDASFLLSCLDTDASFLQRFTTFFKELTQFFWSIGVAFNKIYLVSHDQ